MNCLTRLLQALFSSVGASGEWQGMLPANPHNQQHVIQMSWTLLAPLVPAPKACTRHILETPALILWTLRAPLVPAPKACTRHILEIPALISWTLRTAFVLAPRARTKRTQKSSALFLILMGASFRHRNCRNVSHDICFCETRRRLFIKVMQTF